MNQLRRTAFALIFFCMAALAALQTSGLLRGYLCLCGGTQTYTVADHCHGPHSADCHAEQSCGHSHEDSSGDCVDHAEVREDLQYVQGAHASAPEAALFVVAILPEWPAIVESWQGVAGVARQHSLGIGPPARGAQQRTLTLLI